MSGRVIARRATMWKVTRRYVLATSAVRLRDSSRFPLFDLTETTLLIRWQEDVASWCSVFNTRPCHGIVWLVILTKCPLYWSPPPRRQEIGRTLQWSDSDHKGHQQREDTPNPVRK